MAEGPSQFGQPHAGQTIDERGLGRLRTARLRTILPDELLLRYLPRQNLNVSAGQADLVLAEDRSSGEDVVVKLYRNAAQLDRKVLAKLYQADARHVVRLFEHGETDGEPWEVQEYCALGTLNDHRLALGGRLSERVTLDVLAELSAAIEHIHSLGITHRDLKPANVLVRSTTPLNLVLTDFGVAAQQLHTVQLQTAVASWGWVAPEVYTKGAVASSIDWWALGAIIHQLLTGCHLLAGADGQLPEDKVLRAMVVDGLYVTDAIESPRWRALVDGLVSFHPSDRWGHTEVEAWLAGQNPPVVRTVPLGTSSSQAPETRELRYVFNGQPVRTGAALVQAMRRDSDVACRLLADDIDSALLAWLKTRPNRAELLAALAVEKTGGARLIRLQEALDPDGQLEFMGRPLTVDEFHKAIRRAERWRPDAGQAVKQAHAWLTAVAREAVLRAMAAVVDEPAATRWGRADTSLANWTRQIQWVLSQITDPGLRQTVEIDTRATLAYRYSVALGQTNPRKLISTAKKTLARRDTTGAPWAENLARLVSEPSSDDLGLLMAIESLVAEVTRLNTEHKSQHRAELEAYGAETATHHSSASKQLRAIQRREGLARRQQRLAGQLFARLGVSALYVVFVASVLSGPGINYSLSAVIWQLTQICLGGVAATTLVDFALDAPRGGLRAWGAAAGAVAGLGGWLLALSTGELLIAHTIGLPLGVGIGWTSGAVGNFALARIPASDHLRGPLPGRIRRRIALSRIPVALSTPSAIGAVVTANCFGYCQPVSDGFQRASELVPWLSLDLFGLAQRPMVGFSMVVAAVALSIASPKLVRLSPPLGWAAVITSVLLSVVAIFGVPNNLLVVLIAQLMLG